MRPRERCLQWLRLALALLFAVCGGGSWAATISLTGQLDPANPQDVFLYRFMLSAPSSVSVQSWGYGGTLSAPGGTNGNGAVIATGGFDPYVSLFSGGGPTATFVASNDDGVCPPGTISAGHCYDSTLTANLPPGTYTLALSSFLNMSFAENLATGNLGDGFIGLGNYGDRSNAFAVDISGSTVVPPSRALSFVPNGVTFGAQTLNATSGPMTVILTNVGTTPVTTSSIVAGGTNASEFTVGGNCVSVTLATGAICTLSVTFRPTATGSRSATITVNSDADDGPLTINVAGTGTNSGVAAAGLSATDVNFGEVQLQLPGRQLSVIVSNVGVAPLTIGMDALAGANGGDFTVLADTCVGQTLNAGNICTVSFLFRPQALGPRIATFTFNSNASNSPVTVALRGVGILPSAIPTLTQWGLLLLSLMLAASAPSLHRQRALQKQLGRLA